MDDTHARPPVDYPLDGDGDIGLSTPEGAVASDDSGLTYAALLDHVESERPITDEMIRRACQNMHAAQQFPFVSASEAVSTRLGRLLRVR